MVCLQKQFKNEVLAVAGHSLFALAFALGRVFARLGFGHLSRFLFNGGWRWRHIIQFHDDSQSERLSSDQAISLLELLEACLLLLGQHGSCILLGCIGCTSCRPCRSPSRARCWRIVCHLRLDCGRAFGLAWPTFAFSVLVKGLLNQDVVLFRVDLGILNLYGLRSIFVGLYGGSFGGWLCFGIFLGVFGLNIGLADSAFLACKESPLTLLSFLLGQSCLKELHVRVFQRDQVILVDEFGSVEKTGLVKAIVPMVVRLVGGQLSLLDQLRCVQAHNLSSSKFVSNMSQRIKRKEKYGD